MQFSQAAISIQKSRQGLEDTAFSMIPQAVGLGTGLVCSVLVARGLGPSRYGQYSLVMSVAGIAATLSDLGIGQTAIRYASRAAKIGRVRTQMAILRWAAYRRLQTALLVTLALVFGASFLAREFWHAPDLKELVYIGSIAGLMTTFGAIPTVYFQAARRFRANAAVGTAQKIILLLATLGIAMTHAWSVGMVVAVSVAATALAALASVPTVPRQAFWPPTFRWSTTEALTATAERRDDSPLTFARFHQLSAVCVLITTQADMWLIAHYLDTSQLGIYSVAIRFTLPLAVLLSGLNTALWPRASALSSRQESVTLLRMLLPKCALLSAASVLYSVAVPHCAVWLFGTVYEASVVPAQLLCLRYCISILVCPFGVIGYSLGMVRIYWIINILQLVVVLTLNFYLLPTIGAVGSAVALVANDLIGALAAGAVVWYRAVLRVPPVAESAASD